MTNAKHLDNRDSQRGSVSTEFVVILALFLLPLLAGMIDVGRMVTTQSILTRAVREAAVSEARSGDAATMINAYLSAAGLNPGMCQVQVTQPTYTGFGSKITVKVTYSENSTIFPMNDYLPQLLVAEATVRHE